MSATAYKVGASGLFLDVSIYNNPAEEVEIHDNPKVFIVPGMASKAIRAHYLGDGVCTGVSGYHGGVFELGIWEYEEAMAKLEELEQLGYPKNFFVRFGSPGLMKALEERNWEVSCFEDPNPA